LDVDIIKNVSHVYTNDYIRQSEALGPIKGMTQGINFEKWLVRYPWDTGNKWSAFAGFPDNTRLSFKLIKRAMIAYW